MKLSLKKRDQIMILIIALSISSVIYVSNNKEYGTCIRRPCEYEATFVDKGWPLPAPVITELHTPSAIINGSDVKSSLSKGEYDSLIRFKEGDPILNAIMHIINVLLFYIVLNGLFRLGKRK